MAEAAWNKFGLWMYCFAGFYLDRDERPAFAGPAGLLLPVRDISGDIIGMQIRPDEILSGKRIWLSSAGRFLGTGSGAPAHVSTPGQPREDQRLYIVEGVLSADICSDRLGAACLGLAGMNNWRRVDLEALSARLAVSSVVIALDRDRHSPAADAERVLLRDECSRFAEATIADWDPILAKGLDDCLIAGVRFTTN